MLSHFRRRCASCRHSHFLAECSSRIGSGRSRLSGPLPGRSSPAHLGSSLALSSSRSGRASTFSRSSGVRLAVEGLHSTRNSFRTRRATDASSPARTVRYFGTPGRFPTTTQVDLSGILYGWSAGGAGYARASAEEFGLAGCFVAFLTKPNVMIDDQSPAEWPRSLLVHPWNLSERSVDEYRARLK